MDDLLFNYSQLALIGTNHADFTADNFSEVNISRSVTRLTSPLTVTIVVLIVFLLSPMILIGNSLVLVSMYRFKRLRTPSNYLVMSLATSDLGVGMFLPVGFYLELNGANTFSGFHVCLFSYGIIITLCCVSVLVMVAIAVDRFTSLARPLRYNNLITHSAVERYIVIFWVYSSMVGFTPLAYAVFVESKSRWRRRWPRHRYRPTIAITGNPVLYLFVVVFLLMFGVCFTFSVWNVLTI